MSQSKNSKNGMSLQIGAIGQAVPDSKNSDKDKTPENDKKQHNQRMGLCEKAPKRLIGPPIIKTKVKPQETENDGVANGTCNGHSKRSKLYTPVNGQANYRVKAGEQTKDKTLPVSKGGTYVNTVSAGTAESQTLFSTVHLSKGISMKRVNKIVNSTSSGFSGSNPSTSNSTNKGSKVQHKSQLTMQTTLNGSSADKKVNSGSSVPKAKAKAKTKKVHSNSAASSSVQSSAEQLSQPSAKGVVKSSVLKSLANLEMTINPTIEVPSLKTDKVPSPLDTYKTLEEFLEMPEIQLSPSASNNIKQYSLDSDKPKSLFKSKYWQHLDPNKKNKDVRYTKNRDKEKTYDPVEVKSYMEKQKEIRKLKELREYDERQKELERKKQQLRELNEKCRSINARRSSKFKRIDTSPSLGSALEDSTNQNNITKKDMKPKIRHSEGSLQMETDVKVKPVQSTRREVEGHKKDMRATALLREFEDIVKKECMQVLQNHMNAKPSASRSPNNSPRPVTYDKAVETTISLQKNYNSYYSASTRNSSAVSSIADDVAFIQTASSSHRRTPEQYHQAAARIQAGFRGYMVRKLLREASILPYLKHKKGPRSRPRMSFYRPPEKPYDSPIQRRLSCVSPVRRSSYIPPQELLPDVLASETRPSVRTLMPSGLRLKPYDEPFPKEVIEKIQQSNQKLNEVNKLAARTELYNRKSTENVCDSNVSSSDNFNSNFHANADQTWQKASSSMFVEPKRQLSPFVTVRSNYLRNIDAPTPTIAEVFKEKLRTFSNDQLTKQTLKEIPQNNISGENMNDINSFSNYKYESDFDFISESQSQQDLNGESRNHLEMKTSPMRIYSPEIPESDSSDLKKRKSSKHREGDRRISNGVHRRQNYEHSTTTVDTDADLVSNGSSEGFALSDSYELSRVKSKSNSEGRTSLTAKTSGTFCTTTTNGPTTSSINMESLPTPALELCYKAEMERMEVINKAYQVTVNYEKEQQLRREELLKEERERKWKEENEKSIKERTEAKKEKVDQQKRQQELQDQMQNQMQSQIKFLSESFPKSSDMNLALMNCQKDAVKATAELAQWMTELKKTSMEKDAMEAQQQPVNLASMVYAAVDEARRRDDEKRQKRREIEKRRAFKERELDKEKERERQKMKENLIISNAVTFRDQQVQFPTSSMCESSRPSSVHEKSKSRPSSHRSDSGRRSELQSVSKAQGKLEKQLLETKKLLEVYDDPTSLTSIEKDSSDSCSLLSDATISSSAKPLPEERSKHFSVAKVQEHSKHSSAAEFEEHSKQSSSAAELEEQPKHSYDAVCEEQSKHSSPAKLEEQLKHSSAAELEEQSKHSSAVEFEEQSEYSSAIELEEQSEHSSAVEFEEQSKLSSVAELKELSKHSPISQFQENSKHSSMIEFEKINSFGSQSRKEDDQSEFASVSVHLEHEEEHEHFSKKDDTKSDKILNSHSGTEEIKTENVSSVTNKDNIVCTEEIKSGLSLLDEHVSDKEELQSDRILNVSNDIHSATEDIKTENISSITNNGNIMSAEDVKSMSEKLYYKVEGNDSVEVEKTKNDTSEVYTESFISEELSEEKSEAQENVSENESEAKDETDFPQTEDVSSALSEAEIEEKYEIDISEKEEYVPVVSPDESESKDKINIPELRENVSEAENEAIVLIDVTAPEDKVAVVLETENAVKDFIDITVPEENISIVSEAESEAKGVNDITEPEGSVSTDSEAEKEAKGVTDITEPKDILSVVSEAEKVESEETDVSEPEESISNFATNIREPELDKTKVMEPSNTHEQESEAQKEKVEADPNENIRPTVIIEKESEAETIDFDKVEEIEEASIVTDNEMIVSKEETEYSDKFTVNEDSELSKEIIHPVSEADVKSLVAEDVNAFEAEVPKEILTENVIEKKDDEVSKSEISTEDIEEVEEEWFEDEMISDDKEEEEALKLEAAKIVEEQNRIENEIRALETLQAQVPSASRMSLGLSDIPDKPPPPYSPPSSDSFSLSRSCVVSITASKVEECVTKLVEEVWDTWVQSTTLKYQPREHLNFSSKNPVKSANEEDTPSKSKFRSMHQSANESFDSLLSDFIQQTIEQVLLVDEDWKSYIDKVRPGPMALQAQLMRLPKTKEALIATVLAITQKNVPQIIMAADVSNSASTGLGPARKKRLTKWSSRPRDQVDEVLVQELIEEDREWTEFWPEELVVVDQTCQKTVRRCIRDILRNLNTALDNK